MMMAKDIDIAQSSVLDTHTCLRTPQEIMQGKCLGAFHASYISFSRSLIRTMIHEKWKITSYIVNLDSNGFGRSVYRIKTLRGLYHMVFFTQYLDPSLRNDRVIANAWDMNCTLWNGDITEDDIDDLAKNVPLQEHGRYSAKVLSISRANKSVRLFEYVANCLANGEQPDVKEFKKIGYLVRTTAVYGNGKFGMADYLNLCNSDFSCQFRAQMLVVYLVRQFTLDWIQYIAKCRNPHTAVPLSPKIAQFLGAGNSTGLGMAPFLIKHPHVVNSWVKHREQALYEIIYHAPVSITQKKACVHYIAKGITYFAEFSVPDVIQQQKNESLVIDLKKILLHMDSIENISSTFWQEMWKHVTDKKFQYGYEMQELFLNILMEIYPEISQKYENFSYMLEPFPYIGDIKIEDIIKSIEDNFSWAINIDYTKPENIHFFWYRSEEKAEPRLGERYTEPGEEKEVKIDIARRVKNLYDELLSLIDTEKHKNVAEFLLHHPQYSSEIKRVVSYTKYPYGEIQENILSKDLYAIDILRLKLAFFGAVKFDPKSDRWLRITLFQGAPLLNSKGHVSSDDNWFLYQYEDENENKHEHIHVSLNELENISYTALESLNYDEGVCIAVSRSLSFLEEIGVGGVSQFVQFLMSSTDTSPQYNDFIVNAHKKENTTLYTFDFEKKSCIHYIEMCIEYIVTQINQHSHFTLLFYNSLDHVFLIPYLQKFARRPLSIQWYDKNIGQYHIVFVFPEREYPEFFSKKIEPSDDLQDMLVVYENEKNCLACLQKYSNTYIHKGVEACATCFQKSIKEGVMIPKKEWGIIQNFAKNIFVPNSDISRQRAGETKDLIDRED